MRSLREEQQEDVALMALKALADIGDEESQQTLLSLYDTNLIESVRVRLARLLEDFDSPAARTQLVDIARRDPSAEVRNPTRTTTRTVTRSRRWQRPKAATGS